jgi:MoaA/NifB/PqqE/SkfB family radical SAM enzyme
LRKDVFEIARYSGELGIISQVSTNGLTLPATYEEATSSFDVIVVSLDTLNPDLYREIRGVDSYDKVIDGLNKSLSVADKNKCNMILNTVVCAENIPDVPDVVRYAKEVGVKGIMIDFATFHDYWTETSDENSRYNPEAMDWKRKKPEVKELVKELLNMKKDGYQIITSNSYLKTFITEDFHYDCYPYIFACVRKDGRVAIPCWDSAITEYYDILHKYNLKELWFSKEVEEKRKQVADCRDCYMHCIVEPSKILGAPSRNLMDLMEWIATFRKNKF